jgi:hypothetical protein
MRFVIDFVMPVVFALVATGPVWLREWRGVRREVR